VILVATKLRNEVCSEDSSFVLSVLSAGVYSSVGDLRHTRATVGRRSYGDQRNSRIPLKSEERATEGRTDEKKQRPKRMKKEKEIEPGWGGLAGLLRDASVSTMDVILGLSSALWCGCSRKALLMYAES
jgi:hypothetical protein